MGDLEESIWLMHLKRVTVHHQHRVKCRNCSTGGMSQHQLSSSLLLYILYILLIFQLQDGRKLGYGGMNGIPMVATSPVRHHDSPVMNPVEIHSYEPPWKALTDFALHTDLDRLNNGPPPPVGGQFQHLVNQVCMYLCSIIVYLKNQIWRIIVYGHHSHLARAIWRPSLSS